MAAAPTMSSHAALQRYLEEDLEEELEHYQDNLNVPGEFATFATRILSTPMDKDLTEKVPARWREKWSTAIIDAITIESVGISHQHYVVMNVVRLFCADLESFKALIRQHEDRSLSLLLDECYSNLGAPMSCHIFATLLATKGENNSQMLRQFVLTALCAKLAIEMSPGQMDGRVQITRPGAGTVRIVSGILKMFLRASLADNKLLREAIAAGEVVDCLDDVSYSCIVGLLRGCGIMSTTGEWEDRVYAALLVYEQFHVMSTEDPEGLKAAEETMMKMYGSPSECPM